MNLLLAVLCVVLFSLTIPATRIAALSLDSSTVAAFRMLGASIICLFTIIFYDRWIPPKKLWLSLMSLALISVLGFSILCAIAMKYVSGAHGSIGIAALPAL